jgi:hypothetical protein
MDANMLAAAARELKDRLGWLELKPTEESYEELVRAGMDLAELVGDLCRRVAELEAPKLDTATEAELDEALAYPVAEFTDEQLGAALDALAELAKPLEDGPE